MFLALEKMGYKKGLTYQSLPYNFVYSYRSNEINKIFKSNIQRIKKLTGKKVVLVAHSLGNVNIKYQLSKLTQEFKDSHLKLWMAITPPFLGAMQATKVVLGGDDEYFFFKMIGFHFNASSTSLGSFPVMYELMLKNMYTKYQDQPWFQWIQKRLDYEQGTTSYADSGMYFWPPVDEKCTPDSFKNRDSKCFSGLDDMRKVPSVKVGDLEYDLSDNEKLIKDWPLSEFSESNIKFLKDTEYEKLDNPTVPMVLVFSKANDTIRQTKYKWKISDYTQKGEYPKAEDVMSYGDGTVPSNSALFPALKWAYEFDNKKDYAEKGKNFKVVSLIFVQINNNS